MPETDATTRLREALAALDLTSADGRAGLGTLLAEIERLAPTPSCKRRRGLI